MDDFRVKKAADILSRFFDETTLHAAAQFETVRSTWRQIVGQRLADHSRPKSVLRHTLLIAADHAGWIQLLQMNQARILARIAKYYPELEITSLAFTAEDPKGWEERPSAGPALQHKEAESEQALAAKSSAADVARTGATAGDGMGSGEGLGTRERAESKKGEGSEEMPPSTNQAQRPPLPEPLEEIFSRLMHRPNNGHAKGN